MNLTTVLCDLGPTAATVVTNHPTVLDHLRAFYTTRTAGIPPAGWTIRAIVGEPETTVSTNQWGVSHQAFPERREIRLWASDPANLAVTTRKTVREILVDYCEQRRYVMLHASAVVDDHRVIVIVGEKGSGKTTLALKAALRHDMRYLSNDHLIIYPTTTGDARPPSLALTSLPTPIPLKIGTYLDLENLLPEPWDTEDLDIDAFRGRPQEQLYRLDRRVLYTFPLLGQPSPLNTELRDTGTGPAVLVVLASYSRGVAGEVPLEDAVEALMPHLRTDWMFDPSLNQRHLPRHERGPAEYGKDGRNLITSLARRATVIGWNHRGDPHDLLEHPAVKGLSA
ncbi:DEAD/DEAH box helicase family protein [Nocardia goodfellowii]